MSKEKFAEGQCLCGGVTFTISSEPIRMAQCHCNDCKKITGTGHASIAFFNQDQVNICGVTKSYASEADSGSTITRAFCPNCGSRLFGVNSKAESMIGVSVGAVEDSSWFKPEIIVYNKRKSAWDFMDETVATFEAMPPAA